MHHRFKANTFAFEIWRLTDEHYRQLRSRSFPIRFNSLFTLGLFSRSRNTADELTLAKALLLLEDDFGPSSNQFDHWKQSFSFPFLLAIEQPNGKFYHLLKIADYRGSLEFQLARVVDDICYADKDLGVYHEPIVAELSQSEIEYLISYLWGYLKGMARYLPKFMPEIKPFFRHIDSNHIIYGYWDGKFVDETIEDEKRYERKVQKLKAKYGEPAPSDAEKVQCTQKLIQSIAISGNASEDL
jgi:hypothetical protein